MNLLEAIQSVDLAEVIDSMNAYAFSRLKSVGVKTFNGRQPVDFVGDLILKVLEGDRDWEKAECSFKEFLFGCLDSEIYNFFKTKNKHADDLPDFGKNDGVANIEGKRKQVSDKLVQEGADDYELLVFEYWMDGIYKPADIAKDAKMDVKEIYNIIKRLERRLQKIRTIALDIV